MKQNFTLDITPNFAAAWRRAENYWSEVAITLRCREWVLSNRVDYAAVNGPQFLVNRAGLLGPEFEGSADPVGRIAFMLAHEALHLDYLHPVRFEGLDPLTANKAGDYVINGVISRVNAELKKKHGVDLFPAPPWVLFDRDLSSGRWSAIEVYHVLNNGDKPEPEEPGEAPEPEEPGDDEGEGDQPGDDEGEGDQPGDDEGEGDQPGDQPGDKPGDGPTGDEVDDGGGKPGDKPGKPGTRPGEGGGDVLAPEPEPGESQADANDRVSRDQEAVELEKEFARRASLGGGSVGRDLGAKKDAPSGTDWRTLLRDWLDAQTSEKWDRPFSPSLWGGAGLIGPGKSGKAAISDLVFVVDASGSVPRRALETVYAELSGLCETYRIETVRVVIHDHEVRSVVDIDPGAPLPPVEIRAGGGTEFAPVLEWIEQEAPETVGVVWLTDGDAGDWSSVREPSVPVLWGHWPLSWFHKAEDYPFGQVFEVAI